jgi:hypothetical protein
MSPSNQVYSAFSFIGFTLCAIPFYWHLEGTQRYFRRSSRHSKDKRHSLEYGHLLVYGMDWHWMSDGIRQLGRMER